MLGLIRRNQEVYNPFREMEAFERAFFGAPFGGVFETAEVSRFRTDVIDEGDHYLLEADLPGFDKKDITLEILNDTLTVRAQRSDKTEEQKEKYVRMERTYGAYQRSFDLTGVNADKIKAKYKDGVLRLTLPKQEKPKGRFLDID